MPDTALAGCYVISLRPVGQHAGLRRAAAGHGARVLALSPWTLAARDDDATRAALHAALACTRVLVTSPNAARAAARLQLLHARGDQAWFAVGSGTARALARAGVAHVASPGPGEQRARGDGDGADDRRADGEGADGTRTDGRSAGGAHVDSGRALRPRMDSEGLLALPGLQDVRGQAIGLVSAPGGRGVIERVLRERGARIVRADVYARVAVELRPRALAALRALDAPCWLALSSGEALERLLAQLPDDAAAALRRARVAAASERLARLAEGAGFSAVVVAASAQPRDLLAAMVGGASASMRGTAATRAPTA